MLQKDLVLVTGCPRSGTTALTRLLNTHPDVAIGMERFTRRLIDAGLERSLFEPDRFTTFVEGDGNLVSFEGPETQAACAKAGNAKVVGDKSPNVVHVLKAAEQMGGTTVLAIVREPNAVVRSFQVRADRAAKDTEAAKYWPAKRDRSKGVAEFNEAVIALSEFIERTETDAGLAENVSLIVVSFEDLFFKAGAAAKLFARLGLSIDDAPDAQAVLDQATTLPSQPRDTKSDKMVAMRARFANYRRVVRYADAAA